MIVVRITPSDAIHCASAGQLAFLTWDRLCKAGVLMPAFSLLHPDGCFKPTGGSFFIWNDPETDDSVYEWSA